MNTLLSKESQNLITLRKKLLSFAVPTVSVKDHNRSITINDIEVTYDFLFMALANMGDREFLSVDNVVEYGDRIVINNIQSVQLTVICTMISRMFKTAINNNNIQYVLARAVDDKNNGRVIGSESFRQRLEERKNAILGRETIKYKITNKNNGAVTFIECKDGYKEVIGETDGGLILGTTYANDIFWNMMKDYKIEDMD